MTEVVSIRTRPVAFARSTTTQRRRWRGINAAISATIGAAVVVNAIYLGGTAPTTSPVTPPAVTQGAPSNTIGGILGADRFGLPAPTTLGDRRANRDVGGDGGRRGR